MDGKADFSENLTKYPPHLGNFAIEDVSWYY